MSTVLRLAVVVLIVLGASATRAVAHCDTLNGPVVSAARTALQHADVTPVLKWVAPAAEAEVRDAFRRSLAVRSAGPAAQELADMYFFETVVRLHRQGEGEPYTGLKPATAVDPAIDRADRALESGSISEVVTGATTHVDAAIRERFARARAARAHVDDSVAAGREYVRAYVDFIHYVEHLYLDAAEAEVEK